MWQVNEQTSDTSGTGLAAKIAEHADHCTSEEETTVNMMTKIRSISEASRSACWAVIAAVGLIAAAPATAQTVTIGTTAQGSLGAALGAALAKVMDGRGMTLRAVPLSLIHISEPTRPY